MLFPLRNLTGRFRILVMLLIAIALIASALIARDETSTPIDETVVIHAGGGGGPYGRLVQLFDTRATNLRENSIACREGAEDCPAIANFNFETACNDGGSENNLIRLGLTQNRVQYFHSISVVSEPQDPGAEDQVVPAAVTVEISESEALKILSEESDKLDEESERFQFADRAECFKDFEIKVVDENEESDADEVSKESSETASRADDGEEEIKIVRKRRDNDADYLALVQNYFIAAAAQTYCRDGRCEPFAVEHTVAGVTRRIEYDRFDELRIVLPLYNGIVQFVSLHEASLPTSIANRVELEDLAGGVVFLQGVNDTYGREVLNRHPGLLTEFPRVLTGADLDSEAQFLTTLRELDPESSQFTDANLSALWTFYNAGGSSNDRNNRLMACDILDAYVVSGAIIEDGRAVSFSADMSMTNDLPPACLRNYQQQQIQIPEVIIDSMVADEPFYQKLDPPASWGETPITAVPGLITYLATNANADDALIEAVTASIYDDWDNIMLLDPKLVAVRDNVLKKPAPYHEGAERALNERDLLGAGFSPAALAAMFALVLSVVVLNYLWRSRFGYDRLGEKQDMGFRNLFSQGFVDFGIIILGWFWVFMMVITAIRLSDAAIASTQNADDQLSALGFFETLFWMITFIASGYDDDVFPASTFSRMVLSGFTILGIAYPLYLIAKAWDRLRTQRLNRARGGELRSLRRILVDWWLDLWPWTYRSKGTLLLCGWNSRGPGLIYSLTCPDSPFAGTVNILANPEAEYPVEHFNFNRSRVRFYRGDPSHRSHLERAEALRAESALILTDESAGPENSSGVLTALAIERLRPNMPVFAEMAMNTGSRDFTEQHIDIVFDPRQIAWQMISIGAFDHYVLDFALDCLSPDDHYEWYAKEVSALKQLLPGSQDIETLADLSKSLQRQSISVVGICKQSTKTKNKSLSAKDFESDAALDPLLSIASMDQKLADNSHLVCAAESPASFKRRLGNQILTKEIEVEVDFRSADETLIISGEQSATVLIIGHRDQSDAIKAHIKLSFSVKYGVSTDHIHIETIPTDSRNGNELHQTIKEALSKTNWTHILLLSSIPAERNAGEFEMLAMRADSDTIMRANFIRVELSKLKKDAILVAEVNKTHNRQLAKDANVSTVVPSSLLIERLLARMVSGKGRVSEMLAAMLSMRDKTFLRSYTLPARHSLIGKPYSTVMNTWYADGRVLGLLPKASMVNIDTYINDSDDFDWHFIMCPPQGENDGQLEEGDVLIVLQNASRSFKAPSGDSHSDLG